MNLPISGAADALCKLREGNDRFVKSLRSTEVMPTQARRHALLGGQSPFAIVLSCSDSRVPSELVFDCGLGDLFVVRVAGNVVAPSIVGSVEFAADTFNTTLVVVMGHSHCGAVTAALSALKDESTTRSPNIHDIVERITPAISPIVSSSSTVSDLLPVAIRKNVEFSVEQLRHGSALLEERVRTNALAIVGAEYSLETGKVTFIEQ